MTFEEFDKETKEAQSALKQWIEVQVRAGGSPAAICQALQEIVRGRPMGFDRDTFWDQMRGIQHESGHK